MLVLGRLIALAPPVAEAHVAVQTLALLAGALHPWMNVESGLTLVGLTLWAVQGARRTELTPFVTFATCVAAGVALGLWINAPAPSLVAYLLALAAGLLTSLNWRVPPLIKLLMLGSMESLAGYLAGVDAAPDVLTPVYFAAGTFSGSLVVPLSVASLLAGRDWALVGIGLRVLGSWIGAISLMLLAPKLRG